MQHSPRGCIADPKPAAIARRAFFANNRKKSGFSPGASASSARPLGVTYVTLNFALRRYVRVKTAEPAASLDGGAAPPARDRSRPGINWDPTSAADVV
jgi:hypothetical protein